MLFGVFTFADSVCILGNALLGLYQCILDVFIDTEVFCQFLCVFRAVRYYQIVCQVVGGSIFTSSQSWRLPAFCLPFGIFTRLL